MHPIVRMCAIVFLLAAAAAALDLLGAAAALWLALWWVPAGTRPTLRQGISRFGRLDAAGPALAQAVVLIAVVFGFTWWLAGRLGLDDRLRALLASAVSICGVSAAIAAAGAVQARKEQLAYTASMVILFALPSIFLLPAAASLLGLQQAVAGAWVGGNIDTTAAVTAAGTIVALDDGEDFEHGMFPPKHRYPRYEERAVRKYPQRGDISIREGFLDVLFEYPITSAEARSSSSICSTRMSSPSARAMFSRISFIFFSTNRAVSRSFSAPCRYSSTFKSLSKAFLRSVGVSRKIAVKVPCGTPIARRKSASRSVPASTPRCCHKKRATSSFFSAMRIFSCGS